MTSLSRITALIAGIAAAIGLVAAGATLILLAFIFDGPPVLVEIVLHVFSLLLGYGLVLAGSWLGRHTLTPRKKVQSA